MTKLFDCYRYKAEEDQEKKVFYENHKPTKEEIKKTKELKQKLIDFIMKTGKMSDLDQCKNLVELNIHYFDGIGYLAAHNSDKDIVDVYMYGKEANEAFMNAAVDFEFYVNGDYERSHREQLNESYRRRFMDPEDTTEGYHAPFFFAELALQDFRKYYGDEIPREIIRYYEIYASKIEMTELKYDYETNGFQKAIRR